MFDNMSTLFSTNMNKINQISPQELEYLQQLANIDIPPKTLYYKGKLPTERQLSVAIVGTRKPTAYGREVTEKLASELARRGIVIISGLAIGIDTIAHNATLSAGGRTIAVLANGLHRIYPSANKQLADKIIASGGAIISEYDPGIEPLQYRFLERNRLISGLADAVIITEAAARSGSLNTAGHALNQGRELLVVPGNITSAMSLGCNRLLNQGATAVNSIEDVLEVLNIGHNQAQSILPIGANPLEQKIIALIASGMRSGDKILAKSGATASDFAVALSMLEINGIIKSLGANNWTLR